jgi:hypothetical protein
VNSVEVRSLGRAVVALSFPELPERLAEGLRLAGGFLMRSGRLLTGLMALEDADCIDTGDGLARAIFEAVATGMWLLDDLENGAMRLNQAWLWQLELLAPDVPEFWGRWLEPHRTRMIEVYGEAVPRQLPAMKARLPAALKGHYFRFAETSARNHASLLTAVLAIGDDPRHFEAGYVPYGAVLTASLGSLVHHRLGTGLERHIHPLMVRLAEICDEPWDSSVEEEDPRSSPGL